MRTINFNNKTFSLLINSDSGEVNKDTVFEYMQKGHLITAKYHGGSILSGHIIALLEGEHLNMFYHCLTLHNELRAGKAVAAISFTDTGKIKLKLDWEWLGNKAEKGVSEYLEN